MPTLRDIMTASPYTTTAETPLAEVSAAMVKGRFGSAVVLQGAWLGGIFTERDALRAAAAGADPKTSTVGEWMTKDPVTAEPDTTVEDGAQIMLQNGFRHLPVLDGKDVIGIVSLRDVLSSRIRRA